MMQKNKKNNSGFTLLETLVAISIFTTSILALLSVLASGISSTSHSKRKIGASYLAQEGVEYINNMRNTYVLYDVTDSQTGWNAFVVKITGNSCNGVNGCYFDADSLNYTDPIQPMIDVNLSACSSSVCADAPLFYDSTTGKYNNSSLGIDSGYTRQIKVTLVSPDEIKVSVTVYWTQASRDYHVTFSESLFNWIE